MSRIRSIKPEFWTSEQVMECSTTARLLFIGLWNFCDDHGRHPFSARQIKAEVMPGDDISSENVRGMLDELSRVGLIEVYDVDGKQFLQVTGWHHQRIDKRQSAKHPPKPKEPSTNVPRTLATDRIGEDKKGEDLKKKDAVAPNGALPIPVPSEETELFKRGKAVLGKSAGGLITQLLKAKEGKIPLARAAIETAATKHDPREYIGAIIKGKDPPPGQLWDPGL